MPLHDPYSTTKYSDQQVRTMCVGSFWRLKVYGYFSMFWKVHKVRDFLFALLEVKVFPKMGSTLKGKILLQWEQILFSMRWPQFYGRQQWKWQFPPLKVYPFDLKYSQKHNNTNQQTCIKFEQLFMSVNVWVHEFWVHKSKLFAHWSHKLFLVSQIHWKFLRCMGNLHVLHHFYKGKRLIWLPNFFPKRVHYQIKIFAPFLLTSFSRITDTT